MNVCPAREHPRLLFHFATGGFAHFLRLLENSVQWSSRWGFQVVVLSESAKTLAYKSFHQIFRFEANLPIVSGATLGPKAFSRPDGKSLADFHTSWQDHDCWITDGEITELVKSLTRLNRFSKAPLVTVGQQKRFFHKEFHFIVPALRIRGDIMERCSQLSAHIDGTPYIGVHFRNTDSKASFAEVLSNLDASVQSSNVRKVVWCSDDESSIDAARYRFPALEIVPGSKKPPLPPGAQSLHGGVSEDNVEWMLHSTISDVDVLTRAHHFVGSPNSAWSTLVPYLRSHPAVANRFFSR